MTDTASGANTTGDRGPVVAAHSPLPWQRNCFLIRSAKGDHVTHTGQGNLPPSRSDESEANAAFIVRVANSHADLVAALLTALDYFTDPDGGNPEFTEQVIRAALAKAGAAP